MASVSIYLNFPGTTEEAFMFYKDVFQTEFTQDGISRMGEIPNDGSMPELSPEEQQKIMHVGLPLMGDMVLMGTDVLASMNMEVNAGNNVFINLQPDTKEEADRLFAALSGGGEVKQEMRDEFWGAYYGSCVDKFGVQWMFNVDQKSSQAE